MEMRSRWGMVLGAVAVSVVALAAPVGADEGQTTYWDGSLRKLGRGIANVVTSPLELIRTPQTENYRHGYFEAMSVGLLRGAWRTVQRGVVGVFEVLTFYAAIPNRFEPIMMPEFVFANGDWAK